tara:strand:+ start:110 stop:310 length:201 start_codon:yes stop_codon:yes gene_type:complete
MRETTRESMMAAFANSQKTAYRAVSITNMLEEKWHQTPHGYKILTKLASKDKKRIDDLMNDRSVFA